MSGYIFERMFVVWRSLLTGHSVTMVVSQKNWSHYSCSLQWTSQWTKLVASEMAQSKDDTIVDQLTLTISPSCTRVGIKYERKSFHYRK